MALRNKTPNLQSPNSSALKVHKCSEARQLNEDFAPMLPLFPQFEEKELNQEHFNGPDEIELAKLVTQ